MDSTLTPSERQSGAWSKVKEYLEARLVAARKKNDSDLDERKTARMRGRIQEIKDLLALGEDKPQVPIDEFKD